MENQHIFFGDVDEFALNEFRSVLENSSGNIEILLSSGGGSVFDGIAIAGMIKRYQSETTVTGIGFVASIATVILLAADNVKLDKNALMMIHNAWTIEAGEASELRKVARDLDKISNQIASVYVDKIESNNKLLNGNRDETKTYVKNLMNRETFLTAEEALEIGLIDEIDSGYKEEEDEQNSLGFINHQNANEVLNMVQGKAPVQFVNKIKNLIPVEKEKTFWDKAKEFFSSNPSKLSELDSEIKAEAESKQNEAIEAAKALLAANGFDVTNQAEVVEAPEAVVESPVVEEVAEVVETPEAVTEESTDEKDAIIAELQAKLKDAEIKAAAPSTTIKTVSTDKRKVSNTDAKINDAFSGLTDFFNK